MVSRLHGLDGGMHAPPLVLRQLVPAAYMEADRGLRLHVQLGDYEVYRGLHLRLVPPHLRRMRRLSEALAFAVHVAAHPDAQEARLRQGELVQVAIGIRLHMGFVRNCVLAVDGGESPAGRP